MHKNRIKRYLIPGLKYMRPAWHQPLLDVLSRERGPIVDVSVHPNGKISIRWSDDAAHFNIVIDLDSGATSIYTKTMRNRSH